MQKYLIGVAVSAALAGCGGGGEKSKACPAAAIPPAGMALYASTWKTACTGNRVETTVMTDTRRNAVDMSTRTDFYANADCSGPVLGSVVDSAVVTAAASGVASALLVLSPGSAPVAAQLDQATLSSTASTKTFSGPWELKQSGDGVRELCLKVAGGGIVCERDPGTLPASSGGTLYFYKQGDTLYRVALSGGTYSVISTATRPYTLPPVYADC